MTTIESLALMNYREEDFLEIKKRTKVLFEKEPLKEMALRKCNEDIIDNVCIAFDMKGFSFSNMDYGFVKQLIWLLSRRYPERLGVCLLINAPLIFSGCWSLIRLWINDVTANKIVFIRDRDHLSEFIATGILPIDDL
ncbi:predicted protein [Nematostella vectensis]|uniref:CRAL-TRIO domain-containing protein n=1 Tax=Nematostella vectensis TaxID=45351 RepID=A7SSI7_NEMVE|nr:predicted protein [Nematostella vectensis]|eukprot:XP_001625446.1 predicted protein [Nematostella vectensis]